MTCWRCDYWDRPDDRLVTWSYRMRSYLRYYHVTRIVSQLPPSRVVRTTQTVLCPAGRTAHTPFRVGMVNGLYIRHTLDAEVCYMQDCISPRKKIS